MESAAALHDDLIAALKPQIQPVAPDDTMAEAGRKILLKEFVEMLKHEAGSRVGEDIEEVHDMRVATRRMRSAFRLLEEYYKPKAVRAYSRSLRRVARALGAVRDLDVQIEAIQKFLPKLPVEQQPHLQAVIDRLDAQRTEMRDEMIKILDKGVYRRFIEDFANFLTTSGAGARANGDESGAVPSRVRHILPTLLYSHLGAVRAYDGVIAEADETTLHALRIEFKRLRYAVSMFEAVLGPQLKDFIEELKKIQDYLGAIQDSFAATYRLRDLQEDLNADEAEALQAYLDSLSEEAGKRREGFAEVWRKFNTKAVQLKLASAVAVL
jgi:CHAD domain-containing protein